jgi:DNA-binding NarL/FixJ family response regulator
LNSSIASLRQRSHFGHGGCALTPETEVATLVAQGLTNRQIAEEFGVAQRTIDTHVERTLAKLGFARARR